VLAAGSALSRLTLRALGRLRPANRAEREDLLAFHREVWRYVRSRRSA
jgi:hypothetical protein